MDQRPFGELSESGLLWLINRVVFHPHAVALALVYGDDGAVTSWGLQTSPDGTPYNFPAEVDAKYGPRAAKTLRAALPPQG